MTPGSKRGLVAPQNTFLENISRKTNQNDKRSGFLLANSELLNWPIVYANEEFSFLTGYIRSDLITLSCLCTFMHGNLTDSETVSKMKEDLEKKKVSSHHELLLYNKEDSPLWFHIELATVTNEEEASVFFLLIFRDITAYKKPIPESGIKLSASKLASFIHTFKQSRNEANEAEKVSEYTEVILEKNNKYRHHRNSYESLPKYHHEPPQTPSHIILHYSSFKTLWDWCILLLTLYTAVIVPYNVAFGIGDEGIFGGWLISDSAVDIVFLLDIVINFLATFVGPGGEVISEPKIIHMNYIKGWFSIDLLSCLPYDLVNFFSADGGASEEGITGLFSALKVARLLRLGRVVRKLDHYIEYGGSTLFLLVCFFALSGHWLACVWYVIAKNSVRDGHKIVDFNWLVLIGEQTNRPYRIEGDELKGGPSPNVTYVAALYFTMTTLTSVGFGNIAANTVPEQIFCVVVLIFGSLLYASIFGNVTSIIQQMYADTNRYHNMLKSVREFMKLYQIPQRLRTKIMDYIVFTWSLTKGIDINKIINGFPKEMKADICVHLNRDVFNKHPAFRLASDSCLRALAVEFVTIHNAPGDMIYHLGESIDALSFITSGSVEVMQDDQVVAILTKGDVFGDSFWEVDSLGHSSCHVKALTYCDLNVINWKSLTQVLDFYEAFAKSFRKSMNLTFNLRKRVRPEISLDNRCNEMLKKIRRCIENLFKSGVEHIFRKISDVEREKAMKLAGEQSIEKDLPENHAVRKLFKRYKQKSEENNTNGSNNGTSCKEKRLISDNSKDAWPLNHVQLNHSSIIEKMGENEKRLDSINTDLHRLIGTVDKLTSIIESLDGLQNNRVNVEADLKQNCLNDDVANSKTSCSAIADLTG